MKKTILSTLCFLLVSCFMFFTDAGTRIVVLGSSTAAGAGVSDSNRAWVSHLPAIDRPYQHGYQSGQRWLYHMCNHADRNRSLRHGKPYSRSRYRKKYYQSAQPVAERDHYQHAHQRCIERYSCRYANETFRHYHRFGESCWCKSLDYHFTAP